ncbi:MAG: dihydroorotate dehydrogenase [Chloroflexi bacterium]|nr:dihydroorotate dehydrogenase [Chloroflexota bacterium]
MPQPDLSVELAPGHPRGLRVANPVLVAAGTFGTDGFGAGLPPGFPYHRLGAIVAKTTTLRPRAGNSPPRIIQGPGWTLNSIGLQNPGMEAVLRDQAPLWATWRVPVLLSIAGESVDEFARLAAATEGVPGIAALEVNASCPNIAGGLDFAQSPTVAAQVTRAVRAATSLPVLVKLTPNVTDILAVARAVAEAGAHALTLTNTLLGIAIDVERRRPALGATTGGVSGPALKPVSLAAVYRVSQAVSIPVVGVGGVSTAQDAVEYLMAGALAVQVGTASFANPWAPIEVLEGLGAYVKRRKLSSVRELVGAAHPQRATQPAAVPSP